LWRIETDAETAGVTFPPAGAGTFNPVWCSIIQSDELVASAVFRGQKSIQSLKSGLRQF
jgi:hypothetical protein